MSIDRYKKKYESTSVSTSVNSDGNAVKKTLTTVKKFSVKLAEYGGMSLMKKKDLFEVMANAVKSENQAKIFAYILANQGKNGYVTNDRGDAISVSTLSQMFDVSRKTVSGFISILIDEELIKKNKRELHVNPYINCPYGLGDNLINALQIRWDCDFKKTIEEILIVSSVEEDESETHYD